MTRNPIVVFLLALITAGAYGIFWHYRTNTELRERGERVRPALSALAVSWGLFLIVPAFVSVATTTDRIKNQAEQAGVKAPSVPVACLLAPLALYAPYLQKHVNRLPPLGDA